MSLSSEYLKSKIADKRLAIQKLDRDRERLLGEVAAYEDMLAQTEQEHRNEEKTFVARGNGAALSLTRGRGLSAAWKAVASAAKIDSVMMMRLKKRKKPGSRSRKLRCGVKCINIAYRDMPSALKTECFA
jgi:hypothetical protein